MLNCGHSKAQEECVMMRERKGKEEYLYSAFSHQGTYKALRHGSHSFYLQTTPCLPFLRGVHQMAPPQQLRQQTSNCSSLLIHRPRKDERLSWPCWLTYSRWLTHISYKSSAGQRKHIGQRPMLYRWTMPPTRSQERTCSRTCRLTSHDSCCSSAATQRLLGFAMANCSGECSL